MRNIKKIKRNNGQAMVISMIFFIFISLAIILGLVSPSVREFKIANDLINSHQSFVLSESAVEDAYFRLKTAKTIDTTETLTIGANSATIEITDSGYNEKTITALGDVNYRQRNNQVVLSTGDGASFKYGIQSGVGGFEIGNAIVYGNVYSNGTIVGSNGATVTGSAFSAGASGLVDNVDVGTAGVGEVRAHTVTDSTIAGTLYCQTGSGNNKACNTTLPDPSPAAMPITDAMVTKWKADANINNDPIVGNLTISSLSTPRSLGPKKITGNLIIDANFTITGTIYVVGNITTSNNAQVSLSPSYGPTGGIIVSDGRVVLSNNVNFFGSGTSGSYVLLLTTSICPTGCSGLNALEILNNVGAILVNAQNGTAHLNNNVALNEVVGNKIIVDNSATITYTSGLASLSFTSGPSGGWNIKSWQEIK